MREELVVAILCLFIILGAPFCGAQECEWFNSQKTFICEKIVYQFPNAYYGKYNMRCQDCQIEAFDNTTFPFENNLQSLNVTHSGIQRIGPKSFSYFKNLQYLHLNANNIKNISAEAFYGLDQLFELHLEDNLMTSLEVGFLNRCSSNFVNISANQLQIIPQNVFVGVSALITLDLSRNKLNNLDKNAFEGLVDLEDLDLSRNSMCNLPLGLFKSLKGLRRLDLAHNKFTRFQYGAFAGLKNLNFLILAGNKLTVFDSTSLLPMMHLTKLDISANSMYDFDANELLQDVPTLRVISLEDNLYSCAVLKNTLRFFKTKLIEMENNENRFEYVNINGIACIEGYTIEQSISLQYFLQKAKEQSQLLKNYC